MAYIGHQAADRFVSQPAVDQFSGDGSTTAFTLSFPVSSDQDILVSVDGVIQDTAAYAVSSGTTLTFTAAPSSNSGNNIFVNYLARTSATVAHPSTSALAATTGAFSDAVSFSGGITGDVAFDTNTLVVDAANNRVGIGTAPERDLHVKGAANDPVHFKLEGDSSDYARIMFDDGSNDNIGEIRYDFGSDYMTFNTNDVERMRISSAGEITKATQPAFQARPASEQSNLPINAYTQIVFGTEVFDIGSNFASNVFTAPVAGKYALHLSLRVDNMDIDTTYYDFRIVTSNRDYKFFQGMAQFDADGYSHAITISCVADMDASDTAQVKVDIPNAGAAQADVNANSFFSGMLIG
tara:strand:- start:1433 stop:2488 length:1056 start_codon:yes stop_codon:yes gene_type:complete